MRGTCPRCGAWVSTHGGLGATLRCKHGMVFVDANQARFVATTPMLMLVPSESVETSPRIAAH